VQALRDESFQLPSSSKRQSSEKNVALTIGKLSDVSEKFAVFIWTAQSENGNCKLLRKVCNLIPTNMLRSVPLSEPQALCDYRRHSVGYYYYYYYYYYYHHHHYHHDNFMARPSQKPKKNLKFGFIFNQIQFQLPSRFQNTGRFIMFSVITNIYNKKTRGLTLMELFTATGKMKTFLTTRDVRCVHHG
jgi:hypothetical protein